jgi:hypothetical protein
MTDESSQRARSAPPLDTWETFWRFYVLEHRNPGTRRLHFAGTALALFCLAAAVLWANLWLVLAAPVVAYGAAWAAHFAVERNTPATFRHPLRSVMADARMFGLMFVGRMDDEVRRIVGETGDRDRRANP